MRLAQSLAGLFRSFRLPLPVPEGVAPVAFWHREALLAFLEDHLPPRPAILDTVPGEFTVALLRLDPRDLLVVGPAPENWEEEIHSQCERQGVCRRSLRIYPEAPRWVLPRLSAKVRERSGRFDLVRLGQCEAWPSAFLELAHAGALLRRGGFLVVDGLSSRSGPHRRAEPPGYRLVLEFGGGLVFEKISHYSSLHDWRRPPKDPPLSAQPVLPV